MNFCTVVISHSHWVWSSLANLNPWQQLKLLGSIYVPFFMFNSKKERKKLCAFFSLFILLESIVGEEHGLGQIKCWNHLSEKKKRAGIGYVMYNVKERDPLQPLYRIVSGPFPRSVLMIGTNWYLRFCRDNRHCWEVKPYLISANLVRTMGIWSGLS